MTKIPSKPKKMIEITQNTLKMGYFGRFIGLEQFWWF